jgi:hypothetical protein
VSETALVSGHRVGGVIATCAEAALLIAHPDRYEQWTSGLGVERARVQLVDWLSRAGKFFHDIDAGIWDASSNLVELEMPVRGLLIQTVNWSGELPVPTHVTATAQGLVPLLGVAQRDPDGFAIFEAPTIPTPKRSNDALESLDDDLVDEGSEVRLLLEQLVGTAQLDGALVSCRRGEVIACVSPHATSEGAYARSPTEPDPSHLVDDLLETSDLFFSLRVDETWCAVRLTGAHAMLVAASRTRQSLELLREPGLGYTLDSLLESFRSRLDRVSSPPTLIPDDEPSNSSF